MSDARPTGSHEDLAALALSKLTRVLGEGPGRRTYDETMKAAELSDVLTPDDLYRFGDVLSKRGGMEAAVGGLLSVAAIMRGAAGH